MTSAEADQLHRKFIMASEPDEILGELDRLDDVMEVTGLPSKTVLGLRQSGLAAMHRILGGDAAATRRHHSAAPIADVYGRRRGSGLGAEYRLHQLP